MDAVEKKEPKTVADLDWMKKTSRNHNAHLEYESLTPDNYDNYDMFGNNIGPEAKIGDPQYRYVEIYFSIWSNKIEIRNEVARINDIKGKRHYTLSIESESSEEYTFEEFKDSKWWNIFLEKYKDGSCDYSIYEDIILNGDQHIEDSDISIELNTTSSTYNIFGGTQYHDKPNRVYTYLNNDGEITITFTDGYSKKSKTIERSVEEVIDKIQLFDLLVSKGFELTEDGISFNFSSEEEK